MNLTNLRFRVMTAIKELSIDAPLKCASPKEVAEEAGLPTGDRARYIMRELVKIGWLERPYIACYKLTNEGRKVLREAVAE